VGIFDSTEEHPPAKIRRYIITGIAFVALVAGGCWYLLRYHTEKNTVRHFLNAVAAGNMEEAYGIWKPVPTYSFKDFLDDWGPEGYYGPVKSFHVEGAEEIKRGSQPVSGVVITVEVSPYTPFPGNDDVAKQSKTKEVHLWVEFKDLSISFPP
jgi:hypothetical protein